jgi:transposase
MMRRFRLRDDQWEQIKDLLPGREGSVEVTAADNRLFVESVLYRYRTGMPWRDLPERFGDGIKVHLRSADRDAGPRGGHEAGRTAAGGLGARRRPAPITRYPNPIRTWPPRCAGAVFSCAQADANDITTATGSNATAADGGRP